MFNPTFGLGHLQRFAASGEFLQNRPMRFIGLAPEGAHRPVLAVYTAGGFYAQDTIRAAPPADGEVGLRYEFTTMPDENYGRDSALMQPDGPALRRSGPIYSNPTTRISRRASGFAWESSGRPHLAARRLRLVLQHQQPAEPDRHGDQSAMRRRASSSPIRRSPRRRSSGRNSIPRCARSSATRESLGARVEPQPPAGIAGDTVITSVMQARAASTCWRSTDVNISPPRNSSRRNMFFPAGAPRRTGVLDDRAEEERRHSPVQRPVFEIRKRFSRD